MKETVLKGVANPPQIFKAPYKLAIINIILNLALMIIALVFSGLISLNNIINPLYFIASTVIIHLGLITLYKREPHIDNILMNFKILNRKTINLDGEIGKKYLN